MTPAPSVEGGLWNDRVCINTDATLCTEDSFTFIRATDDVIILNTTNGIVGYGKPVTDPSSLSPTADLPNFIVGLYDNESID